jgi:hypothetical protein
MEQQKLGTQSPTAAQAVFVSYSWDTELHKKWVLAFVTDLRKHGINAFIDQTHLRLGADSPQFMEQSVRDSGRVLVICTEKYKEKFDNRWGGAGFEGHIITAEMVNELGKNKFIPVLRGGDWITAIPTALAGLHGIDLRNNSAEEFQRLVRELHGVALMPPIGSPPDWLFENSAAHLPEEASSDPIEYWKQRKRLPETEVMKKIWSKSPRWYIWIRPTEFRTARFQNVQSCRQFMLSSSVTVWGWYSYPFIPEEALQEGPDWISGEIDHNDGRMTRIERCVLFRSGQFVHHRGFDEIPQLGTRVHVLEILDTVTAAFEFAARMAERNVLFPTAAISFELFGVDGRELTWPTDLFGTRDAVTGHYWCQEAGVNVTRRVSTDELKIKRRQLALEVALEIYSHFGWLDPPKDRLVQEQAKRIG